MPSCVLARAHRVFMVWPPPFGRHPCEKPAARLVVGSLEPLVFLWAAIETRLPAQLDQLPAPVRPAPARTTGKSRSRAVAVAPHRGRLPSRSPRCLRGRPPRIFQLPHRLAHQKSFAVYQKSHSPLLRKVIRRSHQKSFAA